MKVAVVTTSYPRDASDVAGRFVARQVEAVRAAGVETVVVSPASFPHFGIAYGGGIAQNLRAQPWRVALVPPFLAAFAQAARRAAGDADVVHAHWIPSAIAARATGKPYVLQVWGTDVELARRLPRLARPLVRGARVVIAASSFLAHEAEKLGARRVVQVPYIVDVPESVEPENPPHVLYAGRLSAEKGVLEFAEATEGLDRWIVGDGPLRAQIPDALGFVPPSEIGRWYERAAVVCAPSRREGVGGACREAMARGRAVVATAVGGHLDAITDGVDGVLVPPRDTAALRGALQRLIDDPAERARLGAAARATAIRQFSAGAATDALLAAYAAVV
ncbi:MAG TPA: glycosyltransferase [Gaiellaceae bacterium]|nr:glycosyltransferase [Gaiellaceae bacterium]